MMAFKDTIYILLGLINRQFKQMTQNHIYLVCMVVLPLLCIFFFSDMMQTGLPSNMPAGVVDLDNSATSRKITRNLDAMQLTDVKKIYPNVTEARRAMQRGDIYGFFYFPPHMSEDLTAARQPTVSFYYNNGYMLAGSMLYKDMKTVATLAGAAVAMYKMSAMGYTSRQIKANLQPIVVDTHIISNPTMDYNVYLSTSMIPTCLGIFIFLITAYSIGTELKFNRARKWMKQSKGNMLLAMTGKLFPQTLVFTLIVFIYIITLFHFYRFPYHCHPALLYVNGFLFVLAAQGFGVFMFGLLPSLRMSMSLCALWSVVSFSIGGFTFPVDAMSPGLQSMAYLFPMRSYYMIYQMVVLNGYSVYYAWMYYVILLVFALLPFVVLPRIKNAMLHYVYIP